MAGPRPTNSYLGSHNFRVTVAGINEPLDGFQKVSEITCTIEPMTFRHGLDKAVRKAPGRTNFEDITLERVYSGLDEFYMWHREVRNGKIDRRTVSIEFLKPDGSVQRRYELYSAYPSKWQLPSMDAGSSNPSVEKITLSVERVEQLQ